MTKLEKVTKGLECCLKESDHLYSNPCNGCPYEGQECIDRMKADALSLLKEQNNCENCAIAIEDRQLVTRCKDCKWYDERISMCDNCGLPREQTFFCADGER